LPRGRLRAETLHHDQTQGDCMDIQGMFETAKPMLIAFGLKVIGAIVV
jgi:hypothetical protein